MKVEAEIPDKDICLFEDDELTYCPFLSLDCECKCSRYNIALDTTPWGVPYKCSECYLKDYEEVKS